MENNYFYVSSEKEKEDTSKLINKLLDDDWVSGEIIIVNCSPDYSSILVQRVNHRLSSINKHELFEVVDLQMPYPNTNQIWNPHTKEYENFDSYLKKWVTDNVYKSKFLFIDSGTLRGKNFTKVRLSLKQYSNIMDCRFASLYVQDTSIFIPDYYVEKFNKEKDGGLLFEWENFKNPNWDY